MTTNKVNGRGILACGLLTLAGFVAVLYRLTPPESTSTPSQAEDRGKNRQVEMGAKTNLEAKTTLPRFTLAAVERDIPASWEQFQDAVVSAIAACNRKPPCDERKLSLEQAGLGFDYFLGYRHPRRAELLQALGSSYDFRTRLGEQFEAKIIDRSQMFAELRDNIGGVFRRFSEILNDEDWGKMFEFARDENPARLLGLSAEHAMALDRQLGP